MTIADLGTLDNDNSAQSMVSFISLKFDELAKMDENSIIKITLGFNKSDGLTRHSLFIGNFNSYIVFLKPIFGSSFRRDSEVFQNGRSF